MVRRIVDHCAPEQVILFGSHARGDANHQSDVDLLVVMRDGIHRRQTASALYTLLGGSGIGKDILVATTEDVQRYRDAPDTVLFPALREGQVLYARRG
jgi:predicted nucleotidyltransferase